MNNVIMTGSRVFGTPHLDSDTDVVVLVNPMEAADLAKAMGVQESRVGQEGYPGLTLRIGGLNVIVESSQEKFDEWVEGTEELVARAPVTRAEAVAVFTRLRSQSR